jgi:hypothetical protein
VVIYPTRLERQRRSVFSSRNDLRVADAKPVRVTAEAPDVTVLAPPESGQPAWYSGAVGRYRIDVRARPTEVAVGDPITITIELTDLTRKGTPLELLAPPPLARIDPLVERFKMPSDPLAGIVERNRKRFTQTIRAANEQVQEIPAIPFSFFDPDVGEYRTSWSEPIPITVSPASTVPLSEVIGSVDATADTTSTLTEISGGILANYVDPDRLLRTRRVTPLWWWAVLLGLPPLLYTGTIVTHRRARRLRDDRGYARQRGARRRALSRLVEARHNPELVGEAVAGYVADRCDLPAGATTTLDVVQALQRCRVDTELAADVQMLLTRCEEHRYAGATDAAGDELDRQARRVVDRLARERTR